MTVPISADPRTAQSVSSLNSTTKGRSDYESELEQVNAEISRLEEGAGALPFDIEKRTRLLYRLYHHASLTGNFGEFDAIEIAIESTIRQRGPWPDLCILKANLDFKFHRLPSVKRDLEMVPGLTDCPSGKALKADLAMQEGRYDEARSRYEEVVQENRTWDNLVRIAYLNAKMGDRSGADQLYLEAEDEITVKEMRSYAWVELQRGVLDLSHGCYEEASEHYQRADKAYSGYWLTDEHVAELLGAQGKFDLAAALYESVVARVSKPELQQAIGELCILMGKPEQAGPWFKRALATYARSAEQGQVHYYHHLADFYADVRENGVEAVKWARQDLELRPNFATQAALAWAYYRNGQIVEALELINKALSSGVRDAHLFHKAAMIHRAAGRSGESNRFLEEAVRINPGHEKFHVHH
jgi:tetratricopeptide (TPR) repeat protein